MSSALREVAVSGWRTKSASVDRKLCVCVCVLVYKPNFADHYMLTIILCTSTVCQHASVLTGL